MDDFSIEIKLKSCDFCGKKLKEKWPYVFKFYKRLFSDDFLTIYEICDPCAIKLKNFITKLRK